MDFMDTVLIIGGGGREHALTKALLRSNRPLCLFAYPGNPGMENDGCMLVEHPIHNWTDLAEWAVQNEVDLTVVGPEIPLVEGIVDIFTAHGLTIFGPDAAAARIEGSKAFAKELMLANGIPTAAFRICHDKDSALAYLRSHGAPVVVKASGLAAGKGAIVCDTVSQAQTALDDLFDRKVFGDAGTTVVIEDKMVGEEASVFVLTDGVDYRILPVAQDHKRIGDNDTGPNTGGMGAYAPAVVVDAVMQKRIEDEIVVPTLNAMARAGTPYKGLLYCGVMLCATGPNVVEYNCRFGDPETQAVAPLVDCDWYALLRACARGGLSKVAWRLRPATCVSVVLASGGYPGPYEKGNVVTGIDQAETARRNIDVYHSGTVRDADGRLLTSGGRVLTVSAWSDTLPDAIAEAYDAVDKISFEGKTFRRDIAARGLRLLPRQPRST